MNLKLFDIWGEKGERTDSESAGGVWIMGK